MIPANPNEVTIRPPRVEGKPERISRRTRRPASTSCTITTRTILWAWTGPKPPPDFEHRPGTRTDRRGRRPDGQPGGRAPVDGFRQSAIPRLDDPHTQRVECGTAGLAAPHRASGIATSRPVDTKPFAAENTRTSPRDGIEGC
jgi:hypothetical protein